MKKLGRPTVLGPGKRIESVLPTEMDAALNQFVLLTGEARASVIRRAVGLLLRDEGLWDIDRATRIPVTTHEEQK